ncbi:uncharacterized protein BJ171DRAFT_240253 [Polychytrium aggregatum]|uniref:uncharacterized protein n=1 Tax=Polychytrium aggregatum TaxID=110093 RepID=UPI0022FEE90A|nr:uncharacterized protein BJ171DRAFT_240253 [Polychytrium aggregatum]KAI9197121.1 hypothetical protein BJ171DRAFT_240253 [Polychytrium aggregatum]
MADSRARRLPLEIKVLTDEPIVGIAAHFDDQDFSSMCLTLSPTEGPFHGLRLHFSVTIPESYPKSPPIIKISSPIPHPNVVDGKLCCDILLPTDPDAESNPEYRGGWCPMYSLQSVFLQLLSFFMSRNVEQTSGRITQVVRPRRGFKWQSASMTPEQILFEECRAILVQFSCTKCGYNDGAMQSVCSTSEVTEPLVESTPSLPQDRARLRKVLARINTKPEIWLQIADWLSDQSMQHLMQAYKPFSDIANAHHLLIKRQLRCFFLRTPLRETNSVVLGIGVRGYYKNSPSVRPVEFDLLSYEAFSPPHRIRTSSWNERFTHFLPLVLTEYHFRRSLGVLQEFTAAFTHSGESRRRRSFDPLLVVQVLPLLMNGLVVRFMKETSPAHPPGFHEPPARSSSESTLLAEDAGATTDHLAPGQVARTKSMMHASEKALIGYFLMLHSFTRLTLEYPGILEWVNNTISSFLQDPSARDKSFVPNLGEFYAYLSICDQPEDQWRAVIEPVFLETLCRSVVWMLDPKHGNKPYLAYLESDDQVSEFRLLETFESAITSLRMLMFHAYLIRVISRLENAQNLQERNEIYMSRYGYPRPAILADLQREVQEIYTVNNWSLAMSKIGLEPMSKLELCRVLRQAIVDSRQKDYHHSPLHRCTLQKLRLDAQAAREPLFESSFDSDPSPEPIRWETIPGLDTLRSNQLKIVDEQTSNGQCPTFFVNRRRNVPGSDRGAVDGRPSEKKGDHERQRGADDWGGEKRGH